MIGNKFDKACRLYLAMSELDDRTATEALRYRRSLAHGAKAVVIMAACLTLIIGATLMSIVVASFVAERNSNQSPDDAPPISSSTTLSSVFNYYREKNDLTSSSNSNPPELINGSPALIWKYQDSEEYYIKTLDTYTLNSLVSEIKNGEQVKSDESELDCLVWISSGNGEVYSPYLKPSVGNIGYGDLFEYDPEIYPSEDFVSAVQSILN